jgi:hypothetical protein
MTRGASASPDTIRLNAQRAGFPRSSGEACGSRIVFYRCVLLRKRFSVPRGFPVKLATPEPLKLVSRRFARFGIGQSRICPVAHELRKMVRYSKMLKIVHKVIIR